MLGTTSFFGHKGYNASMSGCQKTFLAWFSGKDNAWALRTVVLQKLR
jgi:hypothetical protein